jgi:hypothetical protein
VSFDFEHWCSWIGAQRVPGDVVLELAVAPSSSKRAANVDFKTDRKIMSLTFRETGEADLLGLELDTGREITSFMGLVLSDSTFEKTFQECLSALA